jgi:hypothetical protein
MAPPNTNIYKPHVYTAPTNEYFTAKHKFDAGFHQNTCTNKAPIYISVSPGVNPDYKSSSNFDGVSVTETKSDFGTNTYTGLMPVTGPQPDVNRPEIIVSYKNFN